MLSLCCVLVEDATGYSFVTNFPFAFCLKVFEGGAGGNVIFRLRNITVATERCDAFMQKFPHKICFLIDKYIYLGYNKREV